MPAELSRAEQFAREFAAKSLSGIGFSEPPPPEDELPPLDIGRVAPMPPAPRAPELDDEPEVPMNWPMPPAQARQQPPVPEDLVIVGATGSYKGQQATLTAAEQAAVGRIVLESAARVIAERLNEARALAPRRRRKAAPIEEAAPAPEKRKRGRPRKIKTEEVEGA